MRIGRYRHTHRPYVGLDMLAAQIAERRAKLAFLRSTWPRGSSTQPIGAASEMAAPTAATLADFPSPDVAVAAADNATDDATAEGPKLAPWEWRQPSLLVSPSPPSPTVVRPSN